METQDNGVRYVIHKIGTPQFQNKNGQLLPAGEWWHDTRQACGVWGNKAMATTYRTTRAALPDGGEWVAVFLNVSVSGDVG